MKPSRHFLILMAVAAAIIRSSAAEENPVEASSGKPRAIITERVTDDQIRKLQADERQRLAVRKPPAGAAETKAPATSPSFEESSDFISYNGLCTFVPKGAILHVPDRYRNCVVNSVVGELLPWRDFLARNRGWLGSLEITLKEASGDPIAEEHMKSALQAGSLVVAVIRGNPTSVAKPRPAAATGSPTPTP